MKASKEFERFMCSVLKVQGYSEDVQQASYDELEQDDGLPIELRSIMSSATNLWRFLMEEDTYLPADEPILQSSNVFATPRNIKDITDMIEGIPQEHRAAAYTAVQMTINYINSKER